LQSSIINSKFHTENQKTSETEFGTGAVLYLYKKKQYYSLDDFFEIGAAVLKISSSLKSKYYKHN